MMATNQMCQHLFDVQRPGHSLFIRIFLVIFVPIGTVAIAKVPPTPPL